LPLFDSTRWDANIYNTLGTEEHILSNIGDPFDTFPDCITVGHDYDDRLILLSQLTEIYARGVGLVYKFVRIENYCSDADECVVGARLIESGVEETVRLISHGME
jgi:hypothetical protein